MGRPAAGTLELPPGAIHKTLWVRRSDVTPALYWWSLPLSLGAFAEIFAGEIGGTRALVHPDTALALCATELRARSRVPGVAMVPEVVALLHARDEGRAAACTIAVFPASRTEADLEHAARGMPRDLERQGFTLAIVPGGEGGMRHRFAFRVPGKVLEAIEALAMERRFGGNLGQVEMAFLQGLGLRPDHRARLSLVLEGGTATLQGVERGGRRRIRYLESQKGYTGTIEELTLREAVGERLSESWRRFPIGVVMLAGLPFFIGAFWAQHALSRRDPSGPAR